MLIKEKKVEGFIINLKGRKNYEAKKAAKLGFASLVNMSVIRSPKSPIKLRKSLK